MRSFTEKSSKNVLGNTCDILGTLGKDDWIVGNEDDIC